MKYLVRFTKEKEGKKVYDFHTVQQELIHEYHEVEELLSKEGYYTETYYDTTKQELKQRYVQIPKTEEDKVQEAIQKELSKTIDVDGLTAEQIKEKLLVFPKYAQDTAYKIGDVVRKLGKLYKCLKSHTSSYDLLPELSPNYWKEVKGKDVKPQSERPFWSADITYQKNDEVIYYGKPYRYISGIPKAGVRPEGSEDWELIVDVD